MPTCRVCRGEYAETQASRCPRCGSDLRQWEEIGDTFLHFLRDSLGLLGLFPIGGAIAALPFFWLPRVNAHWDYLFTITLLAIGSSGLLLAELYLQRYSFWEQHWAAQVYETQGPSLISLMMVTGATGILSLVLWLFIFTTSGSLPTGAGGKFGFAILYTLSFSSLTVAATLFAVQNFIDRLNTRVSQPLFVNTTRLLHVVLGEAKESLDITEAPPKQGSQHLPAGSFQFMGVTRIQENGGIRLLLRQQKPVEVHPDGSSRREVKWQERAWRIEGDRWGRIKTIKPSDAS